MAKALDDDWGRTLRQRSTRQEAVDWLQSQPVPRIKLPARLKPFTAPHFSAFASHLELDSGESWKPEPFQLEFLADVFSGVPESWLVVPEGNGKTTLIAGLALYVCEYSKQPVEIPVAASAMEQARILYRQAESFVLRSPVMHEPVYSPIQEARGKLKLMSPRFQVLPGIRRIEHFRGSRIQIVAADDRTGDGVIFALAILDELHRHRSLDLYRTWVGKRHKVGGQIIAISTAGEPGGEFETTREQIRLRATATNRRGGFVRAASEEVVLHEWAVPETGDVEDLVTVKGANPLKKITLKTLASKRRSPTMTLEHWRRFTCNLPTRSGQRAIGEVEWEAAKTDEKIPPGQPIWVGLDLAYQWDTTAVVPFWWRDPEFRLLGPAEVLVPPRDGNMMAPHLIQEALLKLNQINPIHTVVMDPHWGAELSVWIESEIGARVIQHTQTNVVQADDYQRFMEGLRSGALKHSGDQALTSHAMNADARLLPSGIAKFVRRADARMSDGQNQRVIDALVAAAMVHSTAVAELGNEYKLLESVY